MAGKRLAPHPPMHESGTAKISSSEQDETGRENCHVPHWANMNGGAGLSLRPLYRELPSAGLLMQVNDKTSKSYCISFGSK